MSTHSRVSRWTERFFLWLGVAALALAGGTAAYASLYQRYQLRQFERRVAPAHDVALVLSDGDVVGRLDAPRIGLSLMVFQGVGEGVLTFGAGHVPGTALPGAVGNIAIAAHRDTFFRKLKGIRPGDAITVTTRSQAYDFIVDSTEVVGPEETRVLESSGRSELTLITCHPFSFVGAAPNRFIVHALERSKQQ